MSLGGSGRATTPLAERRADALPRTVILLGVVSLFTDLSSEMIYPLLPVFLVSVLGAGAVSLGRRGGIALRDWAPRSMLRTKVTRFDKPAFSVIDVHNHLGRGKDVAAIVPPPNTPSPNQPQYLTLGRDHRREA